MRVLAAVDVRDAGVERFLDDLGTWSRRGHDVHIDLVYAMPAGPSWLSDTLARALGAGRFADADAAQARLSDLLVRLPEAQRGAVRCVVGNAVDTLVSQSRTVDLLVMCPRAPDRMDRALLGSVSQAVIRRAECPVLLLPQGCPAPARPRLVFGVDVRGEHPEHSLPLVAAWARAVGGVVDLVHVDSYQAHFPYVLDPDLRAECEAEWRDLRDADRVATEALLAKLPEEVRGEARIEDGDPVDELSRLADTADLLVVATHGRTGATRWWLGSVAEKLVASCTKPMLVARAAVEG